jgi:hypothetical protein
VCGVWQDRCDAMDQICAQVRRVFEVVVVNVTSRMDESEEAGRRLVSGQTRALKLEDA